MVDTDIAHPSGRPISPGGDQGIEPAVNNQPSETDTVTDTQAEKHDVLLDGRLKASLLSARVAGAGDLSDQRVPARAYHDLVAFQQRQESRGDRGGS